MATEAGLGYPIRPPKSYTSGRKSGQPTVIVIHTTEGHENATSAEDGAAYDARRTDGTSTHFFVDSNSVVQCVRTTDEAHAARAHGNDVGIQIEACGKAGQSTAQWNDVASDATLDRLAELCVKLRAKYPGRFPLRRLVPNELRAGGRGFAGHVDCTYAWPEDKGTHTDPGPRFPWSDLFARIATLEDPDMNRAETLELLRAADGRDAISDAVLQTKLPAPKDIVEGGKDADNLWYVSTYLTSARENARNAVIKAADAVSEAKGARSDVSALRAEVASLAAVLQRIEQRLGAPGGDTA